MLPPSPTLACVDFFMKDLHPIGTMYVMKEDVVWYT